MYGHNSMFENTFDSRSCLIKILKSDSGNNKYLIFLVDCGIPNLNIQRLWIAKYRQIGCFPVPKWSLLQYLSDKNVLIAREKTEIYLKYSLCQRLHTIPLLIYMACGISEMGYYKRLSHVREQEKHGAHVYGIYMYRISLDWAWSETGLKQHFILKGISSPAQDREFLGIFLY